MEQPPYLMQFQSAEDAIKFYFSKGYGYRAIVLLLSACHGT